MISKFVSAAVLAGAALLSAAVANAHPADENPDLTLPETTQHFRNERFGLIIHWGLYSTLCDGEDVMSDRRLAPAEYERLARFFNPAEFNAAEWVSLAKAAGARFIVFTAKHQDGFAMWDSPSNEWNVAKSTPFARDVVKELATECQKEEIKLFLSYAPLDWYRSQAFQGRGSAGGAADEFTTAAATYTETQITELFSKYGKIDGLWLDGWWDHPEAGAYLRRVFNGVRRLQPAALLGNSRGDAAGEDYTISEGALPDVGAATDATLTYSKEPVVVTRTINQSRGYQIDDQQYESTQELVHELVRAAGSDANLALNIGAMPNGQIQPEFQERLRRVGMWLAKHGESVYSTRGGPMPPQSWGVTTHRGRKIYVHVLDDTATTITVTVPHELRSARYYSDESDISFEQAEGKVTLNVRPVRRGELERLVVLETKNYSPQNID